MKGKELATKYYEYFITLDKATEIDEEYKPKVEYIIKAICDEDDGCSNICVPAGEACTAMKFLIRHLLWTCKNWSTPETCIQFKNMLVEHVISDFG